MNQIAVPPASAHRAAAESSVLQTPCPSQLRERHRKHPMRVATVRERVEHRGLILVS